MRRHRLAEHRTRDALRRVIVAYGGDSVDAARRSRGRDAREGTRRRRSRSRSRSWRKPAREARIDSSSSRARPRARARVGCGRAACDDGCDVCVRA